MGISGPIGGIQPFAELAQGGTTLVYKGYERSLDRFVLLKVLRPEYSQDEGLARRFEEEARLVARVQHPNVVAIYAYGQEAQGSYMVAEFVEGVDLRELIAAGRLPVELSVFILLEAACGLQAAHERGILHRDIKPANLMISHEGQVKLADFGMASLLSDDAEGEEVRGTLAYLAPEQVRGEAPSMASDLFSLGATFYEMLTGRAAFHGGDAGALLDAILHHDPVRFMEADPFIPAPLRDICRRLLEKEAAQRWQETGPLIAALDAYRRQYGPAVGSAALREYLLDPDAYRAAHPPVAEATSTALLPPPVHIVPTTQALVPAPPALEVQPAAARTEGRRAAWQRGYRRAVLVVSAVVLLSALAYAGITRMERREPGEAQAERRSSVEAAPGGGVSSPGAEASGAAAGEPSSGGAVPGPQQAVPRAEEPARTPAEQPRSEREQPRTTPPEPEAAPEEVEMRSGTLRIAVQPYADVFIDGVPRGEVGLRSETLSLPAGRHEILMRHPDFPPYRAVVDIAGGEETRLNVSLLAQVGLLTVQVSPWAKVYIDGKYRGTTPFDAPLVVEPGRHVLTLRHDTFGDSTVAVSISAGESKTLKYVLGKRPAP